ncbi:MAG: amino acid racemase [Gammaproteobacteria bacterium]|nr:amino acid racemase [Gammaproteobacteria bacterium]
MSRTVGVLGGMGPDATVDFMSKVIAATPAEKDQDHLRILVDSNPQVPNRQEAVLRGGEDPGPALAAMAKGLEASGADFLVMPCNTAHAFRDAITAAVDIPLVSIIDVTVDACDGAAAVGVLATDGCLASKVFQEALAARGLRAVLPGDAEIAELMRLITRIKAGDRGPDVAAGMRKLAEALVARGADAIIAGCTEIPLVLQANALDVALVSSTDVLAAATVAIALSYTPSSWGEQE